MRYSSRFMLNSIIDLTTQVVSIEVTKSASYVDNNSNGKIDTGDRINYTIIVNFKMKVVDLNS